MRRYAGVTFTALCAALFMPTLVAGQEAKCAAGGKIADVMHFSDGSVVRVIERKGNVLRYEAKRPQGPTLLMEVRDGFYTLSADADGKVTSFDWLDATPRIGQLNPGSSFSANALMKGPDGTVKKLAMDVAVGATEVMGIEGCNYPTIKVTVRQAFDGVPATIIVRNYHVASMTTLRTTLSRIVGTEVKQVSDVWVNTLGDGTAPRRGLKSN